MSEFAPEPIPSCHDASHRRHADELGLWTFIATEILFFGGLFVAYAVYRHAYPASFAAGSRTLEYWLGTLNTAVLLTSSLALALGDAAIRRNDRPALRRWLLLTLSLGLLFLGIKFHEYFQKYQEHMIPGAHFSPAGTQAPQLQLFIFLYFAMTGLHAAHMLAGLGALGWLYWLNHRGKISARHHAPVAMVGLYWHFVDCVWVFLYPLLYLIPPR
jgi:cytochrome c oxidase subunit 3